MSEPTLKFLSVKKAKAQCRIAPDVTYEDEYLQDLCATAERKLLKDIQHTYDEVVEMEGEWPIDLTQAALVLVAQWYKYREPANNTSMYTVPYTAYEALYMPYRKGTYSSEEEEEE